MRSTVGTVAFDNLTMDETVAQIQKLVESRGEPAHICTGNLHHLAMLQNDAEFRAIYASAALVLADGSPVVWLSRLSPEGTLKERVTGSDLFWRLAQLSATRGVRLFYLGGVDGAAEQAAEVVRKRYPGVQVCGTYCPPFKAFGTEAEQERIRAAVCDAKPDILLVGLGAPKQEKWIGANKHRIGVPVSIGVGASFEMAAGLVQRAPVWMQKVGMEWGYRLVQEPMRLWRRYILNDVPLVLGLALCAAGCRKLRENQYAPGSMPSHSLPSPVDAVWVDQAS
ncbi:MAG TPA: WecB/TagA/CpsF family glycosyltransferase [Dehalococcoidia bacterium]|jgi:N-acetylglucosaminyldiphosphoundecaprenol N-acetyl-beta-D-mannosaminyltransferase|nr:WecB/TagA/CpsF family glycosyltransferase [Dehalococcoidia bacterium]